MTPSGATLVRRRRLVVCVDGTWCREDGITFTGNQTNINRIWASVREGECESDATGEIWTQETHYIKGLGTADELDFAKRMIAGAFGKGYSDQIRKVYRRCCELDELDEVWLYGFSRGAFVVRAVAGLLHHIRAIKAKGEQFEKDYKEALSNYRSIRRMQATGKVYHFVKEKTKPAPRIKFVGALDTVKALRDDNLHDVKFNDSIQHMRHALALHEDRVAMHPEAIYPDFGSPTKSLGERTFVQAWFVGNHMDIGGSKLHDGLSLYPLQWILEESRSAGLVLGFVQITKAIRIDDPLSLVFPDFQQEEKEVKIHTFTTANGIKSRLHDISGVHKGRYTISLHRHRSVLWSRQARGVFAAEGSLCGYHSTVPQGSIIHPSVYFLLFEYASTMLPLDKQESELQQNLHSVERKMLGTTEHMLVDYGFWSSIGVINQDISQERWPIRILVCGNAGVGKSTLINKVFGVPVTESSERVSGTHDIRSGLTWTDRPDLIIHDTCGFEAASQTEISSVEEFLQDMSKQERPKDRLHIIWFCLPTHGNRNMQNSTQRLFQSISTNAPEVPILLVATQKDFFVNNQIQAHRSSLRKTGRANDEDLEIECENFALDELRKRVKLIENEMHSVMKTGTRVETCISVSHDDPQSIQQLTNASIHCIDSDEVRLHCIAAQVTNIDIKIDAALLQVMKSYKAILATAAGLSMVPGTATTEKTAAVVAVCRAIILCFGLPTVVDFQMAYEILKTIVWDDMGNNVMVAFAEAIATAGVLGSIATLGMPVFLASSAINVPLIVPAISRLCFILTCDLILILVMCFKESINTKAGQPTYKDLERSARMYRWSGMSTEVHNKVKALIPRHNVVRCYQLEQIEAGIRSILEEYRAQIDLHTEIPPPILENSMMAETQVKPSAMSEEAKHLASLIESQIASEEPPSPTTRLSTIENDLDWDRQSTGVGQSV